MKHIKVFALGILFFCLVANIAFAEPNNWHPYTSSSANQAVYASDSYHSGAHSLKLINSISGQSYWYGDTATFNAPYPRKFTFSGWAKGQNITSGSLAALDFYIVFEDNSTTWYYSDTRFSTGTYNWASKSTTKIFTKGIKSVAPYLILYNGKGTIWFDDIEVSAFQNTVLNSNAEQGTIQPDNWATYENNLNNQTGWATDAYYSPRHSLKIINTLYKNAGWVGSKATFNPPYSRTVTLGGYSKAQSVTLRSGGLYTLDFYIKFEDNSVVWYYPNALRFTTGTHAWQARELTVTFPKGIKELQPYLVLYNGKGTVWFDDAYALIRSPNSVFNPGMEDSADITPPTGTIKINNDTQYTNTTAVTLTLSAQDNAGGSGLSRMKFSNDNINWSAPETYTTTKMWDLTSGDGAKTAYAVFSDKTGNWSTAYSDSIILDTAPPAAPVINPVTSPTGSDSQTITGTKSQDSITIILTCPTAVAGAASYPTITTWLCEITGLSQGANIITAKAIDAAGNESSSVSASIEYTAPAVYWVLVDEHDTPLPAPEGTGWYYNCTGGDRGKLNEGPIGYSWDNNSSYTATVNTVPGFGWQWCGMWYSPIRAKNDNTPLNFGAIFGPYIKPEHQGKITALELTVNSFSYDSRAFRDPNYPTNLTVELKDQNGVLVSSTVLSSNLVSMAGTFPRVFTVPLNPPAVGNVNEILWKMDHGWLHDTISVDKLRLKASVPVLPTEEQAFLWTYSWLMRNYNSNTGMVNDKSRDGDGDMESVSATAKAAKDTYYAYKKGYITHDDAVAIITKIANTLVNVVPRGPQGKNTLWPHFTENGGTTPIPSRNGFAGTEWSSGDTAYAALDIIAALQMIGDPQDQIAQLENFLKAINWQGLLLTDGSISHGYYYEGNQIPYSWMGFGMETMGVNWAYASATGNVTNMLAPPSDNGSGFIDNAQYPMVFSMYKSGIDGWGNDWNLYRSQMASQQISWYSTPQHYNQYLSMAGLFGLSAAEVPDIAFNPTIKYNAYGTGGRSSPNDGNDDVITLHYSGMMSDIRPTEAIRMWETLRDRKADFLQNRIIISPLNNMDSMKVDKNTGKVTVNNLKGSWNMALQAEGWAMTAQLVRQDLQAAVDNNAFLKSGAELLSQPHVFPHILRVPQDYATIQAAINAAVSGDEILVSAGTYNENIVLNKSGIIVQGQGSGNCILQGANTSSGILCDNISGTATVITGFTITGGSPGINCFGTVSSLRIDGNIFKSCGVNLENNAAAVIKNNDFRDWTPIYGMGNNKVDIIGNTVRNTIGPNYPGIYLNGATALIKDNYLRQRWNGAIKLNGGTTATLINNKLDYCYGWSSPAGFVIYDSTATLSNNLVYSPTVYSSSSVGVGLHARNSTVNLYNNIFYQCSNVSSGRGVAINTYNTNLTAKNNIICNTPQGQEAVYFDGTGTQDFSYNDLWANNTTAPTTGINPGPGNIAADPLFNLSISDFHLGAGSLCIDAGDPVPEFNDKDDTRNDMGIYGGPNSP